MGLFNSPERAARAAERKRMFAEEEARAQQRKQQWKAEEKQARHARAGYDQNAGRINNMGGYGVTIHDDGTVDIGDREIGDFLQTRIAGAHATLETLESARSRVTATRLVALGVFAFAVPKRDRRLVMVITAPGGFEAVIIVSSVDEVHLRQWVAWFNREGAQAAAAERDGSPEDAAREP